MKHAELKSEVESRVRVGDFIGARRLLAGLNARQVARKHADDLANLARRAGRVDLSLKILSPIIRADRIAKPATAKERANYAVSLLRIGAIAEAKELLRPLARELPEARLYLGFSDASEWHYESAARHFQSYLGLETSDYQKAVARVNLLAAYLAAGDRASSAPILERLLSETRARNWTLLHLNTLELSAQLAIQSRDFELARSEIEKAGALNAGGDATYELLLRKWRAIAGLLEEGPTHLDELLKVRARAEEIGHWETVRDADFHRAVALKDETALFRIYFGTRFESYRARIEKAALDLGLSVPKSFVVEMRSAAAERVFDLRAGCERNSDLALKPGRGLYRALEVLTSDLYRPFPVGALHSDLFPGEYFNPHTSPTRVAFLLSRLRKWLRASAIPAEVIKGSGGFRIRFREPYALLKTRSRSRIENIDFVLQLERLKRESSAHSFSSDEAARRLSVSPRQGRKILAWALEEKRVRCQGRGRGTRYYF